MRASKFTFSLSAKIGQHLAIIIKCFNIVPNNCFDALFIPSTVNQAFRWAQLATQGAYVHFDIPQYNLKVDFIFAGDA